MSELCSIDDLSIIWQRVLNRPSVGTTDNFFEVGGTPQLADQMFQQVADLCGRLLPSVIIYQAPTISTLAPLLRDYAQTISCPPVLPIRGGTAPVVFLAHGIGGDAMQLFHLAQDLNVSKSIYATQIPGIDGITEPLKSIEEIAIVYLRAMKAIQPRGPYILIGYSFGGLVMMEIAHRLQAEGETVALLAMIDTYPHRIYLRPLQHLPLVLRSVLRRLSSIRHAFHKKLSQPRGQSPVDRLRDRIYEAEFVAWRNYRPSFYAGKIYFLQASVSTCFPKNVRAVWGPLSKEFELHEVPGDHTSLIASQHKVVADLLTRELKQIPNCKCVA